MICAVAQVALLAEGVDRNIEIPDEIENEIYVALLAEGVDRNYFDEDVIYDEPTSPSSRRAWIEIATAAAARRWASRRPPRGGRG